MVGKIEEQGENEGENGFSKVKIAQLFWSLVNKMKYRDGGFGGEREGLVQTWLQN